MDVRENSGDPGRTAPTFDVVGRVVSEKQFSSHSLQLNIERLLRLVRGFQFQFLSDNCFILQFNHKLDRTHALEGCSWLLDRCALLLSLILPEANPETMALNLMNIVVCLHNIPTGFCKPDMARRLCWKLGTVLEVIPPKGDVYHVYMRVRVQISMKEPFQRGTFLRLGEGMRQWVSFCMSGCRFIATYAG